MGHSSMVAAKSRLTQRVNRYCFLLISPLSLWSAARQLSKVTYLPFGRCEGLLLLLSIILLVFSVSRILAHTCEIEREQWLHMCMCACKFRVHVCMCLWCSVMRVFVVYVCVYVYARMYAHLYARLCLCMHVCMYVCMYVCTSCIYLRMCVYVMCCVVPDPEVSHGDHTRLGYVPRGLFIEPHTYVVIPHHILPSGWVGVCVCVERREKNAQ